MSNYQSLGPMASTRGIRNPDKPMIFTTSHSSKSNRTASLVSFHSPVRLLQPPLDSSTHRFRFVPSSTQYSNLGFCDPFSQKLKKSTPGFYALEGPDDTNSIESMNLLRRSL
ncbi:hypothetical protein MRB53_019728 [Persea americana]|uniref:Uncharacterized protein n=1 Tax=Persea americana TaxID=3435 RepID=A0ACC2KZV2_PERAE|nr:hypothetical protein MRB53_019728 [Persea americana]